MNRASQIVVLCEDTATQRFIWRYLRKMGFLSHEIFLFQIPAAKGCGEQWVREHYAALVLAYRQRQARAESALIVVIDADRLSCAGRLRQLEMVLEGQGIGQPDARERIARLVPKRNIETWICCLSGESVTEQVDCSKRIGVHLLIPSAASVFYSWSRPGAALPKRCVPSLRAAIPEVRRLEGV